MKGLVTALICTIFSLLFIQTIRAQSHGLVFSSYEVVQEKRTFLDLGSGAPLCIGTNFRLSFDIAFLPSHPAYFGYVFRLINQQHQNIDLLYTPRNEAFNIITGEQLSGISFHIDTAVLQQQWHHFTLEAENSELAFYVNDKPAGHARLDLKDGCFNIVFGASSYPDHKSTDLPPMKLRNISLDKKGKPEHFWPLRETKGNNAIDTVRRQHASVANPTWVAPLHQHWQQKFDRTVKGNAGITFDAEKEEIVIIAADSIYRFSAAGGNTNSAIVQPNRHHQKMGAHYFVHPLSRELWQFNLDHNRAAVFDIITGTWEPPFPAASTTEYWQANQYYSPSRRAIYFLGGYGQLRYKNRISRYDFNNSRWDSIKPAGETFVPRYLAACGARGDSAYILGGFGSTTGEQILHPRYLYDLLLLDTRTHNLKKLWSLPAPKDHFVFSNSMVIDPADESFYALIFPNDRFNTRLQLIKGSLKEPQYHLLADTIPYEFQDNRSYSDLFYCSRSQKLLAVTMFTEENKAARIKIWSIAFPPDALVPVIKMPSGFGIPWWYWTTGLAFLVFALLMSVRLNKAHRKQLTGNGRRSDPADADKPAPEAVRTDIGDQLPGQQLPAVSASIPPANDTGRAAILFFGNFTVTDKDGQDLTRQFTPLLKELFLLIALHTLKYRQGISVEHLNEILWNDKSDKAAKNNRSVNMLKVKTILEKLGNSTFRKETGKWVFHYEPDELYTDFAEFLRLCERPGEISREQLPQLLQLVKRGAFLSQTEYGWLDDIKSDVSGKVLDLLLSAASRLNGVADAEILIETANAIFVFDQVNEEALGIKVRNLVLLGRHSLAKHAFEKFAKDYRHMYDEDYPATWNELLH